MNRAELVQQVHLDNEAARSGQGSHLWLYEGTENHTHYFRRQLMARKLRWVVAALASEATSWPPFPVTVKCPLVFKLVSSFWNYRQKTLLD